ncbi:MAG: phage holin family protein [Acidobacteriota bacterium]
MVDRRPRLTWKEVFTSLAASIVEVVKAELEIAKIDAARGGKKLGVAVAALVVLLFLLFWAIGFLYAAAILALQWMSSEWWSGGIGVYEATAWVTGLFLLVFLVAAGTLFLFGRGALGHVKQIFSRVDDHVTWWRDKMFIEDEVAPYRDVEGRRGDDRRRATASREDRA